MKNYREAKPGEVKCQDCKNAYFCDEKYYCRLLFAIIFKRVLKFYTCDKAEK